MARLIRFADCAAVPWKNGGGTTRELWKLEESGAVLARISAASISGEQAFSRFEGFDRVILQLEGPAVVLTIAGRDVEMLPAVPIAFRGEAEVSSRVAGAALDLNLMAWRARFRPAMRVVKAQNIQASADGALCAALVLEAAEAADTALQPYDVMMLESGETLKLKEVVRLVVMELHPGSAV